MSWDSGTFTLDGGADRFEQEFLNNDDVNYQSVDAQFLDVANGINLCFPADGSKVATGNWDMGGFNLLNLDRLEGDVTFPDTITVLESVSVGTSLTVTGAGSIFGGLSVYGAPSLIDDDLTVTGTIINPLMPVTGTFTPEIFGSAGAGTFEYSQQDGTYTQIGNDVWFTVHIAGFWSSAPTGDIRVDLPSTVATGKNFIIKDIKHVDIVSDSDILATAGSTNDYLTLQRYGTNGNVINIDESDQVSVINEVIIQGRYIKV
jgi:hypothetical protein